MPAGRAPAGESGGHRRVLSLAAAVVATLIPSLLAATAAIATILNIKPVMHVDNEGYLVAVEKVQGRKKSLRALFDHMQKTIDQEATDTVFIGHCDAREDAEFVASLVRESYPNLNIHIDHIGTSIGAHSGPGTIALFFVATER